LASEDNQATKKGGEASLLKTSLGLGELVDEVIDELIEDIIDEVTDESMDELMDGCSAWPYSQVGSRSGDQQMIKHASWISLVC
jgi:hypothetical protein